MDNRLYQEFDAVAEVAQRYFTQVALLSAQSPPPGRNAANGWFRNSMASDPTLAGMVQIAQSPTDEKLQRIYQAYQGLNAGLRSAFASNENHSASWINTGQLFWPTVAEFGAELAAVVSEVFQILGDDQADGTQDKSDLGDAINDLIAAVNASDLVTSGTHANGWIAGQVDSHGRGLEAALPLAVFPADQTDDINKLAGILRATGMKFYQINNVEHRPWLRADWQVRFEAIVRTAATAIKVLRVQTAVRAADSGLTLRGDAATVAASQPHEVAYFARKHGLTMEQVLELIREVGNRRAKLEEELARRRIQDV